MATAELRGHAVQMSTQGTQPGAAPDGTAEAAGLPSGRGGGAALRLGERPPAAVQKRGPYMVTRAPSIQAKLRECSSLHESLLERAVVARVWAPESHDLVPRGEGVLGAAISRRREPGKQRDEEDLADSEPFDFQRSTGTWPRPFYGERACWGPCRTAPILQGKGLDGLHLHCQQLPRKAFSPLPGKQGAEV